eukprot:2398768-Lingulodinium_polyedra.AAC.1
MRLSRPGPPRSRRSLGARLAGGATPPRNTPGGRVGVSLVSSCPSPRARAWTWTWTSTWAQYPRVDTG